jgi:hypothetical protein
MPAKLQFFQQDKGILQQIAAIIQAFQVIFRKYGLLEQKGCTIAGIYFRRPD